MIIVRINIIIVSFNRKKLINYSILLFGFYQSNNNIKKEQIFIKNAIIKTEYF
jgi:hypothetical protein